MEASTELLLGLLTIVVGLFGTWLTHKQKQVEAKAIQREQAIKSEQAQRDRSMQQNTLLIDQLQEEVQRLAADLRQARGEIQAVYTDLGLFRARLIEVEIGAKILTSQVETLGAIPDWRLPPPLRHPSEQQPTKKDETP